MAASTRFPSSSPKSKIPHLCFHLYDKLLGKADNESEIGDNMTQLQTWGGWTIQSKVQLTCS